MPGPTEGVGMLYVAIHDLLTNKRNIGGESWKLQLIVIYKHNGSTDRGGRRFLICHHRLFALLCSGFGFACVAC